MTPAEFRAARQNDTDLDYDQATSRQSMCLTHIVRFVTVYVKGWGPPRRTYHLWCGQFQSVPVPVEGEMFGCHKCIALCEKYGEPTFRLIPSTGCEVSEGRRGRRKTT